MTGLNWVDYAVIGVFLASMLAGLTRGLVKEVIGLLTWVVAVVVAAIFANPLANKFTSSSQVQGVISSATDATGVNASHPVSLVSIGISFVCIFIGILIVGKIINYLVSSAVEGQGISFTNRLLGAVFGLARGFLLVIIAMFLVGLTPVATQSYWTESQFVASLQPIVHQLGETVQPGIENLKTKVGQTLKNVSAGYL